MKKGAGPAGPISPRAMNALIEDYVRETYLLAPGKLGKLVTYLPVAYRLHEWFLGKSKSREGRSVPKGYLTLPEYRAVYLLYFAQLNAIRFQGLCMEAFRTAGARERLAAILSRNTIRIMDVGAGPGSAAWGWYYALSQTFPDLAAKVQVELHLVDRVGKVLIDAERILASAPHPFATLKTRRRPFDFLEGIKSEHFDIVFLSFTLTELGSDAVRWRLVSRLYQKSLSDGLIIILEPGQSTASKHLSALRNRALQELPDVDLLGPCPDCRPCPLARPRIKGFCSLSVAYDSRMGPYFRQLQAYIRKREKLHGHGKRVKHVTYSGVVLSKGKLRREQRREKELRPENITIPCLSTPIAREKYRAGNQ